MTPFRVLLIPLALACALVTTQAAADSLLVQRVERAKASSLPRELKLLPVGGITPQNLPAYVAAGASGFGLGSALYKPGDTAPQVADHARDFVAAWRAANGG